MAVKRNYVVQGMLSLFDNPSYLEVGVAQGSTFKNVSAARKVAVDPAFRFDTAEAAEAQPGSVFYDMTSDEYFFSSSADEKFDVIYLDGLHTFHQTLRDLMNSLNHVADDGIIVVDDIWPSSLAAALPAAADYKAVRKFLEIERGAWMGDVYRLVMFVDTFCPRWSFACVEDNHGQMVMWQKPRQAVNEREFLEIGAAGYDRAIIQREMFNFLPYEQIVENVKASREG